MPVLENGKLETEEEEMEQETPGSNNSSDDDSEMGSEEEDGSGKFVTETRGIPPMHTLNLISLKKIFVDFLY